MSWKVSLNKKGSALIWAMLVMGMLSIFVAAAIAIAFSYHQRSLNSNTLQQAYFSARSTANAIATDIAKGNETFLPKNVGDKVSIDSIAYPSDKHMGTCTAVLERINDAKIAVTGTAVYGKSTSSVTVDLVQKYTEIRAFTGGALIMETPAPFSLINGDYFYGGNNTLSVNFTVDGNLFAPFAKVVVEPSGYVSGAVLAKSCSYNSLQNPPSTIIVEDKLNSVPVPKDVIVAQVASINDLLKKLKGDEYKIPESFIHLPDIYDSRGFSPTSVPPPTELTVPNKPLPDITLTSPKNSALYCIATANPVNNLICDGGGWVFISVGDNIHFTLSNIVVNDKTKVCFLLGEYSSVIFDSQIDSRCSFFGSQTSKMQLINGSSISGEIIVGEIHMPSGKLKFTTEIFSDKNGNSDETILVPAGWKIAKYEDGDIVE
ncbi:MAG: hypothetical protein RSD08_01775 [Oscillospiraceae bacterium]